MKIIKNYTFVWWEMVIFKASLLCLGIAIGAYWQEMFMPYITSLIVIGATLGIYIAFKAFSKKVI